MIEVTHLRCDRCTDDNLFNFKKMSRYQSDWAFISHNQNSYDICRDCWKLIAEHAGLKSKTEESKP